MQVLVLFMDFKKKQSAGYLVNHVARLFARGLAEQTKPLGITPGTFPVLLELWEQDGQTQKQLVIGLDIEQATMANTLARMERDKLITRRKDESDGRAQRIWLTPHARGLQQAATTAAIQVNASILQSLSEREKVHFVTLMQKVLEKRPNGS